jgi:hypothetical protein
MMSENSLYFQFVSWIHEWWREKNWSWLVWSSVSIKIERARGRMEGERLVSLGYKSLKNNRRYAGMEENKVGWEEDSLVI